MYECVFVHVLKEEERVKDVLFQCISVFKKFPF